MRLHGLLSFPLTPFLAEGTTVGHRGVADRRADISDSPLSGVDLQAFAAHVEHQISHGPSALFVACGTGEFTALSFAEFRDVVSTAVSVAKGRLPVMAGCGGGPQIALEFALAAAECGADGLLLLPPYLVSAPPLGIFRYVEFVAGATSLPVVVYQRANARFDPATAVKLLDLPTVVGIKDGIGDVDLMLRIVTAIRTSGHPRALEFGFLNGLPTAELTVQAYEAIGIDSYSSAVLCFAPDIAKAFYRGYVSGDAALVQRLLAEFYIPFAALRDKVPGYAVSLVKDGAGLGRVRPPLIDVTPEHHNELQDIIARGRAVL